MNAVYNVLVDLASPHDAELKEGYERYAGLLNTILSPSQLEDYAEYIRQSGEVRIFEELTSAELAGLPAQIVPIAQVILADENISMENRRVVALLNQRGKHGVAPDLGPQRAPVQ